MVGGLNSASKVAGAVKVAIMARYFGTSDSLDAFLIAFLLPAFVADVIGGCIAPSLIPVLMRVRASQGERAMGGLASAASAACCGFMVVIAIVLAAAAPVILPLAGSGFSESKLREATNLFYILLFWLPVSAFVNVSRALLNVQGSFALPALAPLATPLLVIIAMSLFANRFGAMALCAGTLAGMLLKARYWAPP